MPRDEKDWQYRPNLRLIDQIVGEGFTWSRSRRIYEAFLKNIKNALAAGENVRIAGFGSFHLREQRNNFSKDGPLVKRIRFRPGSKLRSLAAVLTQYEISDKCAFEDRKRRHEEFEILFNIGIAYEEMSLHAEAALKFEKAVALIESDEDKSRFINSCNLLGICRREMGDYEEAERRLLQGIEASSRSAGEYIALRYELGLLYETWGRREQASEVFFDVYEIDSYFRRVSQKIKAAQKPFIQCKRSQRRTRLIAAVARGLDHSGMGFLEEIMIVNISRRGAGLRIRRALEPGSYIDILFPQERRIKTAKVVWCAPSKSAEWSFNAGVMLYNKRPE